VRGGDARLTTAAGNGEAPGLRFAILGLVTAAAIHAFVIPEHFREAVTFGLFFLVVTALQLALAVALSIRPGQQIVRYSPQPARGSSRSTW